MNDHPPASLYYPSPRPYTGTLAPVEYPGHVLAKCVNNAGTIRLKKRLMFLGSALKQHPVGLEEVDGHMLLGRADQRDYIVRA